jgi:hypothetical protein
MTRKKMTGLKFFFNKRLLYQFKLAEKNGYADQKFRKLFSRY